MRGDNDSSPIDPQVTSDDAPVNNWLKEAHVWWSLALAEAGSGFRARLDSLAKQPPKARQEAPLTDFDRAYQEHVPAKLEGYVRLGATMIGLGLESFTQAHTRIMRVARKYGAGHLSDGAFWALDSWIDQALLTWIDQPPPEGIIGPAQLRQLTGER